MDPKAKDSRIQGVELGSVSLTITLNDSLGEFILYVPTNLCLLVRDRDSPGELCFLENTLIFHWTGSWTALDSLCQWKIHKRITVLTGLTDPDFQEKLGLLLHNGENMSISGVQDSLRDLLVILCPMRVVNGHSQQLLPEKGKQLKVHIYWGWGTVSTYWASNLGQLKC